MLIYIYCLFVKLEKKERKRWMKNVLVQFGVLLTDSKVITSAAMWDAQRSSHLSVSYFFHRLFYCLALLIKMTQKTLEAFPLRGFSAQVCNTLLLVELNALWKGCQYH